jgi:DNA-binding MarR family transcriptional regulator
MVEEFRKREHKIPSSYMVTLLLVARYPGEGPSFYAEKLGTSQPVASRNLHELGNHARIRGDGLGLVDSEIDPGNLRQKKYFLTEEGRILMRNLMAHYERYEQRIRSLGSEAPKPDMEAATDALMEAIPVLDPKQAKDIASKVVKAAISFEQ